MKEQGHLKSSLSSLVYGFKSLLDLSSFFAFLSIGLILFLLGFIVIFKTLGLGAFLNGGFIFTPSTATIVTGESVFVISFLLVVFSLCTLFYYKLYYLVSRNMKLGSLIKRSLAAFPKFLIATFIQSAVSIIGLIALVIPGIYYGSSLMFFNFFSIYGNSTLHSAFSNSRSLAKDLRRESLFVFVVYIAVLFAFVYLVNGLHLTETYSALAYAFLLSYWAISYSNASFNLADKNTTELTGRSSLYKNIRAGLEKV